MYSGKQKSGTGKKKTVLFCLELQSEDAGWE